MDNWGRKTAMLINAIVFLLILYYRLARREERQVLKELGDDKVLMKHKLGFEVKGGMSCV
jgi:hypothetical protein